jgi:hypothetical protein
MYCNSSRGACFFFDIDVKGGESVVISRMLQWYNWMLFKGFQGVAINSKGGDCWHVFQTKAKYACFSLMEKITINNTTTMMEWQDKQCNLRRRRNSDRWIPFRIPMTIRSELRLEERTKEENISQASDLSAKTDHRWIQKKEHDI